MVNGLKTAIEKPTFVAKMDIPKPVKESHPREKARAIMIGTRGMTSSKIPKKAPSAIKKKVITRRRGYFRPPNAVMIREMADFNIPLLSITAKATPTRRINKIIAITVILPGAASTSNGAVNQRQTG
jgi:hypothetical protein